MTEKVSFPLRLVDEIGVIHEWWVLEQGDQTACGLTVQSMTVLLGGTVTCMKCETQSGRKER